MGRFLALFILGLSLRRRRLMHLPEAFESRALDGWQMTFRSASRVFRGGMRASCLRASGKSRTERRKTIGPEVVVHKYVGLWRVRMELSWGEIRLGSGAGGC